MVSKLTFSPDGPGGPTGPLGPGGPAWWIERFVLTQRNLLCLGENGADFSVWHKVCTGIWKLLCINTCKDTKTTSNLLKSVWVHQCYGWICVGKTQTHRYIPLSDLHLLYACCRLNRMQHLSIKYIFQCLRIFSGSVQQELRLNTHQQAQGDPEGLEQATLASRGKCWWRMDLFHDLELRQNASLFNWSYLCG